MPFLENCNGLKKFTRSEVVQMLAQSYRPIPALPEPGPDLSSTGTSAPFPRAPGELTRGLRIAWMLLLSLILSACAVTWVSPYEKSSVERTTEISKNILSFYQSLLSAEPDKRAAAVTGGLQAKQGDIETQIRLHLLLEQARTKNDESIRIAGNLLESWQTFSKSHQSKDSTALSDATLNIERGILERHLRSALVAEESKKLGAH